MSNPGVIILEEESLGKAKFKRFAIEDNIGEAIHLHIDHMRIDFTIKEFFEFSEAVKKSLYDLNFLAGYGFEAFDEQFLKECSNLLADLEDIKIEEIELAKLKCVVRSDFNGRFNWIRFCRISEIPAYKYLQGDKNRFLNYKQENDFNMTNEKRLLQLLKSIEENGYPFENKYVILFNGQDIVRDGQHRVAVLAHLYGLRGKIKVMRFYFRNNKHHHKINNLRSCVKWILLSVYRRTRNVIRKCLKR